MNYLVVIFLVMRAYIHDAANDPANSNNWSLPYSPSRPTLSSPVCLAVHHMPKYLLSNWWPFTFVSRLWGTWDGWRRGTGDGGRGTGDGGCQAPVRHITSASLVTDGARGQITPEARDSAAGSDEVTWCHADCAVPGGGHSREAAISVRRTPWNKFRLLKI